MKMINMNIFKKPPFKWVLQLGLVRESEGVVSHNPEREEMRQIIVIQIKRLSHGAGRGRRGS